MTQRFDNKDGRMRGRKLQARRLAVWAKDPRCAVCGRITAFPDGFQLDHKVPLFKGGQDIDENCQVLCAPNGCHDSKTAKDMGYQQKVAIGLDGWPT